MYNPLQAIENTTCLYYYQYINQNEPTFINARLWMDARYTRHVVFLIGSLGVGYSLVV